MIGTAAAVPAWWPRGELPDEDSQISDTVNGLKVDVQRPYSGTAAVMQTTEPNHNSSVFEGLRRSRLELIHALTLSMLVDVHVASRPVSHHEWMPQPSTDS